MKNFDKIKALAAAKKIKLSDVAISAGITYQQLNRIVRTNSTTLETLKGIASALDVPVSFFLEDEAGDFILNGDNSPGGGKNNTVNPDLTEVLMRAFDEIAAQRKVAEEAQRQSARLLEILSAKFENV